LALVELSVVEQRYRAVLQVLAGVPVIEVAAGFGVSRQSVHAWVKRYRVEGLAGLADRSKRPVSSPGQMPASESPVSKVSGWGISHYGLRSPVPRRHLG
jgi:transposase-like protein